jgi:type II secretory pathway pseudopilin PulG
MKRSRGGLTLVEVLVAMVVAVAALGVLAQGFTTGARASGISQNTTRAAFLAEQVISNLETGELPLSQSNSGSFEDEPGFAYETTTDSYTDSLGPVTGLNAVTITIRWKEREAPREYVLSRLLRDRPQSTP